VGIIQSHITGQAKPQNPARGRVLSVRPIRGLKIDEVVHQVNPFQIYGEILILTVG
jgi:hypothetical protein